MFNKLKYKIMANCLVTKLKSVVNNDNLPKFGCLYFKAKTLASAGNYSYFLKLETNDEVTISIKEEGYQFRREDSQTSVRSYTLRSSMGIVDFKFENGDYTVEVTNKYSITKIYFGYATDIENKLLNVNIDELKFNSGLTELSLWNSVDTDGSLSSLEGKNLTTLDLSKSKVIGNITSIASMKGLTSLNISNTEINGDISVLSEHIELNTLRLSKYITGFITSLGKATKLVTLAAPNIEGTYEELATAMISNGRTSGTLTISTEKLTYNGELLTNASITFNGSNYTVTPIN